MNFLSLCSHSARLITGSALKWRAPAAVRPSGLLSVTSSFSTRTFLASLSLNEPTEEQSNISNLIALNNLSPAPGSKKISRRVGRGIGSTKGKTCGKGHKGAKARTGNRTLPGFEGGQLPLFRRVRKYGFNNERFARTYQAVNLGKLQYYVDRGMLDTSKVITLKDLYDVNLVRRNTGNGAKLLAGGAEIFSIPNLRIEVNQCSDKAREVVEKLGGTVTTIYMDKLNLRKFLKQPLEEIDTKFAAAKKRDRKFFDVWHYIPDEEGRPSKIDPSRYELKSKKAEKKKGTKGEEETAE